MYCKALLETEVGPAHVRCLHSALTPSQILSLFRIQQHFNLRLKSPSCIIPCLFLHAYLQEATVPAGTNTVCFFSTVNQACG